MKGGRRELNCKYGGQGSSHWESGLCVKTPGTDEVSPVETGEKRIQTEESVSAGSLSEKCAWHVGGRVGGGWLNGVEEAQEVWSQEEWRTRSRGPLLLLDQLRLSLWDRKSLRAPCLFAFVFIFILLAPLHSLPDLSSLTGNGTWALGSESSES